MKKFVIICIIAAVTLASYEKEENEVCTTCTIYNDLDNTVYDVYFVCLTESTMENFLEDVYKTYNPTSHTVCTHPK